MVPTNGIHIHNSVYLTPFETIISRHKYPHKEAQVYVEGATESIIPSSVEIYSNRH